MYLYKAKCKNLLRRNNNQYIKNEIVNHNTSLNEWQNSIYSFNKNLLLKTKDNIIHQIINSYFNSIPTKLLTKNIKRKWMSSNRIFISRPEIKHNINNVTITVYIFNKYNSHLLKKIKNLSKLFINTYKYKSQKIKLNENFKTTTFLDKFFNNGIINNIYININKNRIYNTILSLFNINNYNKNYNIIINNIIKEVLIIKLRKFYLYKYNAVLLFINNFKFNINNIIGLNNILNKIYNKKVNLNIISLKYLFLDNSIITEAIVRKVNNRSRRILKVLRKAKDLAKKAKLHPLLLILKKKDNNLIENNFNNDNLFNYVDNNNHNIIVNTINNKYLTGIKLQGSGRLTKRLTASRSILKYTTKGTLKNITSSFQGNTSTLLKGYSKSNIQYLNINSKNRNGSFGIKSWSSSY